MRINSIIIIKVSHIAKLLINYIYSIIRHGKSLNKKPWRREDSNLRRRSHANRHAILSTIIYHPPPPKKKKASNPDLS